MSPTPHPPTASRTALVAAEQIRTLYRNTPVTLIGNTVMASLMVIVLWDSLPRPQLGAWLAVLLAHVAARTALWGTFRRADPAVSEIGRWGSWSAIGSGVAGVLWGIGGFVLYVPEALHYQLLLLFVLIGMGSSAVYALTSYMPAFLGFLLPCLMPTAISFAMRGDALHQVLGVMTLFYMFVTVMFSRRLGQTLADSLNLRFENIELVQELTRKKDEAERANVAKSRFLAAASHDLRQPVHALNLFVQSLRQSDLGAPERRLVENVGASVEAMGGLFDALLDISKLDAGVVEPDPRDFRIDTLLQRLETEHAPQAQAKGLRLRVRGAPWAVVYSDPALLERLLRNLLSNAVRHTKSGKIMLGCRRRGPKLRIEVWDTGPGIPNDRRHDIFMEFVQLGNPERDRSKGLGLGLAIVDRLAKLLDYHVDMRSVPSRGSRFAVEVPSGDASRIAPPAVAEARPSGSLEDALVVVVDDEASILDGMRTLLASWGCEVVAAASRTDALRDLAEATRAPDLVISDYRLRDEENGVQVIEALQAEFNVEFPGLLITGDTGPHRLREAQASGFTLLHKPVSPARLRSVIEALLEHRRRPAPMAVA